MPEERFDAISPYYRFRAPYTAGFFTKLSEALQCTDKTRLLDIACGSGELSVGMAPYVGSITALDISEAMLRSAPSNPKISYVRQDFNDRPFAGGTFDHFVVGRAVHWLSLENLAKVIETSLLPGGRMAMCGSSLPQSAPWVIEMAALRRDYFSSPPGKYRENVARLKSIGLREITVLTDTVAANVNPQWVLGYVLSFSGSSDRILADLDSFKQKLAVILRRHMRNGRLDTPVISRATLFGR